MDKKALWIRIKAYQFNGLVPPSLMDSLISKFGGTNPSRKAFAAKIAQKRGWTQTFSLRVIDEYLKYVYLGMVSEHNVTPPEAIDQVWHQHILFSKGYRAFCKGILGRDFDHKPELVADQQQSLLFKNQFMETVNLYMNEFGVPPPEDIWGKTKFGGGSVKAHFPAASKVKNYKVKDKRRVTASGEFSSDIPLFEHFAEATQMYPNVFTEFPAPAADHGHKSGEPFGGHSERPVHSNIILEDPTPSHEPDHSSHHVDSHIGHDGGGHSCSSCSSSSCGGGGD